MTIAVDRDVKHKTKQTRKDIKYCITKQGQNTELAKQYEQQLTMNQQQQSHCLRPDNSLRHLFGGGGLNAFYWYPEFAIDSVVVRHKYYLARMEAF